MKRLMILSSAIALAGGWQLVQAQPPGGGGFGMSFDAINMADEDGNKDDHLTVEEVTAFFEQMLAGRGGGGRGGNFDPATIFATWDTDPDGGDGKVTEAEFDARPRGGRGGGGGRFGGGGQGGGGAPQPPQL